MADKGSPAGAGIDLGSALERAIGHRFPRRRGDRPLGRRWYEYLESVPPQARG